MCVWILKNDSYIERCGGAQNKVNQGREREREVDQSQKGQSNYGGVFLKVLIKKVATGKRADLNRVVTDLSNVCPPSTRVEEKKKDFFVSYNSVSY